MLGEIETLKRLNQIYAKIPQYFNCRHCHKCCGPIIWFKPEEIFIKDYLAKNNIKYVINSSKNITKHDTPCPYLKNDKCIIYTVRPIVCRLQGNIHELPCKYNKRRFISKKQLDEIKKEFNELIKNIGGTGMFYSTCKYN